MRRMPTWACYSNFWHHFTCVQIQQICREARCSSVVQANDTREHKSTSRFSIKCISPTLWSEHRQVITTIMLDWCRQGFSWTMHLNSGVRSSVSLPKLDQFILFGQSDMCLLTRHPWIFRLHQLPSKITLTRWRTAGDTKKTTVREQILLFRSLTYLQLISGSINVSATCTF